jgi:hypothetical protein
MSKRSLKFLSTSNNTTAALWVLHAACSALCETVDTDWSHEFAGLGMPVEIDCADGWDKMNEADEEQFIMLEGKLGSGHDFKFIFWMAKNAEEGFLPGRIVLEVDNESDPPQLLRATGTAQFDESILGKVVVGLKVIEVVDDEP